MHLYGLLFTLAIFLAGITCQREILNKLYANRIQGQLAECAADIGDLNFQFTLTTLVLFKTKQSIGMNQFTLLYKGTVMVNNGLVKMRQGPEEFRQFVLYIIDTDDFFAIIRFIQQKGYDNTGYFIIVCAAPWPQECDASFIFRNCQDNYVTNVVLLSWNGATVSIKSYFPYRSGFCRDYEPILVVRWNYTDRLDSKINLFQDKLRNLHQCQLTISTFPQRPFMYYINTSSDKQGFSTVYGIEGSLLVELAKILNFTAVYIISNARTAGYFDGHTWTGSLGDVVAGRANISACAASLNLERAEALQISLPYYSIDMVWTAPPTELEPAWKHLYLPFRYKLWSMITVTYVIIICLSLVFKIKSFRKYWRRDLNMGKATENLLSESWIVFIGQYLYITSKKRFVLCIIMLWISLSFFVRNAYQGALFGALKKEVYRDVLQSFNEAVENGYRFGGALSTKRYYEQEPEVFKEYEEVLSKDFYPTLDDLSNRKYKFLLAIQKEITLAYLQNGNGTKSLYILPDKIVNTPSVLYMRKYSPLADSMNRVMSALFESGFPQMFISTFSSEKFVEDEVAASKRVQLPLNMKQLIGCFAVLVAGILMSTILFITELLLGK